MKLHDACSLTVLNPFSGDNAVRHETEIFPYSDSLPLTTAPAGVIVYRRTTMHRTAQVIPAKPASGPVNETALALLAKALGHPARIHIVRLLMDKQSCIGCDIADEIGLAQSTTSEHLRILKAAGIITGEIERPRVCYSLNPTALDPLCALLNLVQVRAGGRGLRGATYRPTGQKD